VIRGEPVERLTRIAPQLILRESTRARAGMANISILTV
jgi:hypothetical protein